MPPSYRPCFGDIHTHDAQADGPGSIERSVEVARAHLDFFAFTPPAAWHDLRPLPGGHEAHWRERFARLRDRWPHVQKAIAGASSDGEFCAFLGFEWRSTAFGDHCVVFPRDGEPLAEAQTLPELRAFALEHGAVMIPHRVAAPRARGGANWDVFSEPATPVVEIYSRHGSAEDDRGARGGVQTTNTVRAALARGLRFGFVASSDGATGFPGAYGDGLTGALCSELSREAIFEALRARRTYALTGDRLEVGFTVEGAPMGAAIPAGRQVEVAWDVVGRDELDVVEIVQDGEIAHRAFARDAVSAAETVSDIFQVRLEWGWESPLPPALERVTDWRFEVSVSSGRLLRVFPCLRPGACDDERRHRMVRRRDSCIEIRSHTSRGDGERDGAIQGVVLEVAGGPETEFRIQMTEPVRSTTVSRADLLAERSANFDVGPFPAESYQWHRLVPRAAAAVAGRVALRVPSGPSFIYLRARQRNGHRAWASPVFLTSR